MFELVCYKEVMLYMKSIDYSVLTMLYKGEFNAVVLNGDDNTAQLTYCITIPYTYNSYI